MARPLARASRGAGILALVLLGCGGKTERDSAANIGENPQPRLLEVEPGDGAVRVDWLALSADGTTLAGNGYDENAARFPMLWRRSSGSRRLDPAPAGDCRLVDVGADGSTFAGITAARGPWEPFLWRSRELEYFDFGGALSALSDNGQWVVGQNLFRPDYVHAYRWSAESGFVDLGALELEEQSAATATSEDGRVVIGISGERAYRWTEASGMQALPLPAGRTRSLAVDVSSDGTLIFGATGSFEEQRWYPTLWHDDGVEELETRSGEGSRPEALNADGTVAVGADAGAAALWLAGLGVRRLSDVLVEAGVDLDGWELEAALDVSADGRVVYGVGSYQGSPASWLASLP
jgi:uncharacterized membrane protein